MDTVRTSIYFGPFESNSDHPKYFQKYYLWSLEFHWIEYFQPLYGLFKIFLILTLILLRCIQQPCGYNVRMDKNRIQTEGTYHNINTMLVMYISAASTNYRTCVRMLSVYSLTRFTACCWSSCLVVSDEVMRKSTINIFILDSNFLRPCLVLVNASVYKHMWIFFQGWCAKAPLWCLKWRPLWVEYNCSYVGAKFPKSQILVSSLTIHCRINGAFMLKFVSQYYSA